MDELEGEGPDYEQTIRSNVYEENEANERDEPNREKEGRDDVKALTRHRGVRCSMKKRVQADDGSVLREMLARTCG